MKKFLAVVLSIQLLLIQVLPADAQLVKTGVRAVFTQTVTEDVAKKAFTQTVTKAPVWGTATQAARFPATNALNLPLENTLTRLTGNAVFTDWVRTEPVFTRANFTLANKENALSLWREELAQKTAKISRLPAQQVHPATLATVSGKPVLQAASEVITDISALGLLGSVQDAPRIVNTYRQLASTPFAPAVQQAAAKALLRLRAYPQLQTLLDLSAGQQANWAGLRSYAQENGLTLTFPETTLVSIQSNAVERLLTPFGAMTQNAVNSSLSAITWYVNLGTAPTTTTLTQPSRFAKPTHTVPVAAKTVSTESLQALQLGTPAFEVTDAQPTVPVVQQTAPLSTSGNLYSGIPVPEITKKFQVLVQKAKQFLLKDKTGQVPAEIKQDATLLQKVSIYLASVVIGLEIGTPIMASLGSSLDLSLSEKILVTAATFLPYSIGSFISNWLKETFGRKASANIGLSLMAGSFITGVTALGLDGSFVPWADSMAHFYSILTSLMVASFGGVFIHNAVGPIMTELSQNASELVRQKRVSYTELVRAVGMLSSYAFPFIATSILGMDWSSSFVMALPFVGLSAAAINLANIPNTKPIATKATEMAAGIRRRGLSWKQTLLDNNYLRLFKEDKSVAPLITGLFLMNGVEMAYNSGFLLMLPSITNTPSSQYLFGLTQYAVPFVLGRFLAGKFLNWFPKHNLSIATGISALGGMAAMGVMDNVYALTAALFAAETGISTAFTLSFAQTAKNTLTQDRVTSLIVASAVACAIFPVLLSDVAQHLIDMGLFTVGEATAFSLVGIPAAMALYSARLFTKVENLTAGISAKTASWWQKLKAVFSPGK